MSKEKEYAKNTIILLIGKFATQFMSLLLIPLYTHYLLTSDYGSVDLIQTYITLFVPILTVKLDSAVFRFLIDERKNEKGKKKIITNVFIVLLISIIIFTIIFLFFVKIIKIQYKLLIYFNIFILMISNIFLQILRGIGKNKEYTISAIISAIVTAIINVICILILKKGASSILLATTIANLICIIYIFINTKINKYINLKLINKKCLKELLKYSLPMIPNELSWWIVNVSDRSIITYFIGATFNGIYTISCKFSNIINTIFNIFNMSWQETASLHINDEKKEEFFSNMINKLFNLFSSLSLLMLAILPFVFKIIIGEGYYDAYRYIPILLFGNIFNILVSLLGGIYIAYKKIKEITIATLIAAIINIILNIIFINKFKLYAASISTFISYVLLAIYRYIDVQKYMKIKLNYKILCSLIILFILMNMVYYYNNIYFNIVMFAIIVCYFLLINKKIINESVKVLRKKIKYIIIR